MYRLLLAENNQLKKRMIELENKITELIDEIELKTNMIKGKKDEHHIIEENVIYNDVIDDYKTGSEGKDSPFDDVIKDKDVDIVEDKDFVDIKDMVDDDTISLQIIDELTEPIELTEQKPLEDDDLFDHFSNCDDNFDNSNPLYKPKQIIIKKVNKCSCRFNFKCILHRK